VVQRAPVNPAFRLAVFKTGDKGWALKTLSRIPKFSYVCEYVGEVIHEHLTELRGVQLAKRKRSNYLFTPTIAPRTNGGTGPSAGGGGDRSAGVEHHYDVDTESFTIDSSLQGHLSRFINHSCSPNLISTCVYVEAHRDEVRLPRVALFAARSIEPGTELCMHYGQSVLHRHTCWDDGRCTD
jgi:euchromatic histone-lysine N-methyltransferase